MSATAPKKILNVVQFSWLMIALAASPAGYQANQKVDAREGDVWSPATVVTQEGRRFQIRYDDGTEEWVTADRLRAHDAAGVGAPPATAPAAPRERTPVSGACQVKKGSEWVPANIQNHDGDLYLVQFPGAFAGKFFWQWVSVDCVRAVGSTKAGPDSGEGVTVGNSIERAKAEAQQKLKQWRADAKAAGSGKPHGAFDPVEFDLPVTAPDTANVKDLLPTFDGAWTYKPEPQTKPLMSSSHPILLEGKLAVGEKTTLLLAGARGVVVAAGGGAQSPVAIQRVDLTSGSAAQSVEFDSMSLPIAISPSGKLLIGRSHGLFGGTLNRLDCWSIATAQPKQIVSFEPYADLAKNAHDISAAAVVDDAHVLTCSNEGVLELWEVAAAGTAPTARGIWRMALRRNSPIAFSPSRATVAVMYSHGLLLLDPLTGAAKGLVESPARAEEIDFTPDGGRLVGISNTILWVWNLAEGNLEASIGVPGGVHATSVVAISPRLALVGGTTLVDLARKVAVWQIDGGLSDCVALAGDRIWCAMNEKGHTVLASAQIPDEAINRAIGAVPADALLIKPGDTVSLDVSVEGSQAQRDAVTAALTRQLSSNGLKLADGQPLKFTARTENGKTKEETYHRIGAPLGQNNVETVAVTEKITRIFVEVGGKVAWEWRTVNTPGMMVTSRADQSIGQAVAAANQFNLGGLQSVSLPNYVGRPADKIGFGKSVWTSSGLKDEK